MTFPFSNFCLLVSSFPHSLATSDKDFACVEKKLDILWTVRLPTPQLRQPLAQPVNYLYSAAILSMSLAVFSDQTSGNCLRAAIVTNFG